MSSSLSRSASAPGWDEVLDTLEERVRVARRMIAAGPDAPVIDLGPDPDGLQLPPPTPAQRVRAIALFSATEDLLRRADGRRANLNAARAYGQ
jgi:hypothetical protein